MACLETQASLGNGLGMKNRLSQGHRQTCRQIALWNHRTNRAEYAVAKPTANGYGVSAKNTQPKRTCERTGSHQGKGKRKKEHHAKRMVAATRTTRKDGALTTTTMSRDGDNGKKNLGALRDMLGSLECVVLTWACSAGGGAMS